MHSDSKMSLSQPSVDRSYASTSNQNHGRKVWICPHLGMNFDQTKEFFTEAPVAQSQSWQHQVKPCPHKTCNSHLLNVLSKSRDDDGRLSFLVNTIVYLLQAPKNTSPQATYECLFPPENVAEALHGLDFPVCAHLRLNHAFILSKFHPRCLCTIRNGLHTQCACSQTNPSGRSLRLNQGPQQTQCYHTGCCRTCRDQGLSTRFLICVHEDYRHVATGQITLAVWLIRDLGTLEDSNHPSWLTHTLQAGELESMASIWLDWGLNVTNLRRERSEWFQRKFAETSSAAPPPTKSSHAKVMRLQETNDDTKTSSNTKSSISTEQGWKSALRCLRHLTEYRLVRPQ